MLRLMKYMLYIFVAVGLVYLLQDILDNSSSVRRHVQSSIVRISKATKSFIDDAYESLIEATDKKVDNAAEQTENMLAQIEQ